MEEIEHILDLFSPLGLVTSRKMFGGYGIFCDGLMFALISDEELYLKADAKSSSQFIELELEPFTYEKKKQTVSLSYFRAPEEILDNPLAASEWGQIALGAAIRQKN